jgi:hypothetical protein
MALRACLTKPGAALVVVLVLVLVLESSQETEGDDEDEDEDEEEAFNRPLKHALKRGHQTATPVIHPLLSIYDPLRLRQCRAPRLASAQHSFPEPQKRFVSPGRCETELREQFVPCPGAKSKVRRQAQSEPGAEQQLQHRLILC